VSHFPLDYRDSRHRFLAAAKALNAQIWCLPIHVEGMELSIDVAKFGPPGRSLIVTSSGLHGVEAQAGVAIQLGWMEALRKTPATGQYLFIHAINPYGYITGRRTNENNVDLNRNFFDTESDEVVSKYQLPVGLISSDYARFDGLLNPCYAPRRFDGFYAKALGYLAREGKLQLQNAIVTGQYEFATGLFYGGDSRSQSTQCIQQGMPEWIGDAEEVCHLDFHTGLGAYAHCQLMVDSAPDTADYSWFQNTFENTAVVSAKIAGSGVYKARGAMGDWLIRHFYKKQYRFLTVEFGTYSALRVLAALREENQAFHFTDQNAHARVRARQRLERCFNPPSSRWRNAVYAQGLRLIEQARQVIN